MALVKKRRGKKTPPLIFNSQDPSPVPIGKNQREGPFGIRDHRMVNKSMHLIYGTGQAPIIK